MQQRCQERAGKADSQAQEPERVHPDGVCRWKEWRWPCRAGRSGWVRYIKVGEKLIDVLEVERGRVLRVWPEVPDGHGDRYRDDDGKQAGL